MLSVRRSLLVTAALCTLAFPAASAGAGAAQTESGAQFDFSFVADEEVSASISIGTDVIAAVTGTITIGTTDDGVPLSPQSSTPQATDSPATQATATAAPSTTAQSTPTLMPVTETKTPAEATTEAPAVVVVSEDSTDVGSGSSYSETPVSAGSVGSTETDIYSYSSLTDGGDASELYVIPPVDAESLSSSDANNDIDVGSYDGQTSSSWASASEVTKSATTSSETASSFSSETISISTESTTGTASTSTSSVSAHSTTTTATATGESSANSAPTATAEPISAPTVTTATPSSDSTPATAVTSTLTPTATAAPSTTAVPSTTSAPVATTVTVTPTATMGAPTTSTLTSAPVATVATTAPTATTATITPSVAVASTAPATTTTTSVATTTAPTTTSASTGDGDEAPIATAAADSSTFALVAGSACDQSVVDAVYSLYSNCRTLFDLCVTDSSYQIFPYNGTHANDAQIKAMAQSNACAAVFTAVELANLTACTMSDLPLTSAVETLLKIRVDLEDDSEASPRAARFQELMAWRYSVNLAAQAGEPCDSDSELYAEYEAGLAEVLSNTTIRVSAGYSVNVQMSNGTYVDIAVGYPSLLGDGSSAVAYTPGAGVPSVSSTVSNGNSASRSSDSGIDSAASDSANTKTSGATSAAVQWPIQVAASVAVTAMLWG